MRFALLVLLGLLLQSVDRDELLVQLAALALLLGAAGVGVGALRSARRAGLSPGVPAVLGVGLFATALLVLLQVLVLVAWPVTSQQARCTARALTHQAQEACTPAAARHLEELLGS